MTLEEAIKHCEEKAKEQRIIAVNSSYSETYIADCLECASDHEQLAEWLKELKALKENKGDLISRSKLKKDLKQYFTDGVLDGVSAKLAFNQILHDIDNAPTVPLPDFKEGYKQAIIDGKTNYLRPQGEDNG